MCLYILLFQIVIGDLSGVDKSTACRAIHRVTQLIANLGNEFISFPTSPNDRKETMRDFYDVGGFPGVLGAIDCTHVAISSPGGDQAELYRNRKGYFSINVQAICSASLKITNIVTRWAGSVHDSTIFNNSKICAKSESGEIGERLMLGDGGYACRHYLLTPLLQTTCAAEEKYNKAQIQTRNPIARLYEHYNIY